MRYMNKKYKKSQKQQKNIWYSVTSKETITKRDYEKIIHKIKFYLILFIVFGLIVYFGIAVYGGFIKVINTIISSNVYIYILAFASVFAGYCLRYIKWSYYIKSLKIKIPFKTNFKLYLSLYSMDITPGRIGRVIMAYTLSKITKVKIAKLLPLITLDIFTDFLGFAILTLIAVLYFDKYIIYILIADIIILLPFAFILNSGLYKLIKKILKKSRFLMAFSLYGDEYFLSQHKLNNLKVYLVSIIVSVPGVFLSAMSLYFVLLSLGIPSLIPKDIFIYTTSQLFGMISTVPGGIGVMDGLLVASISTLYNISVSVSSAITIMTRMASLWFGTILGFILFISGLKYWKNKK